MKYMFRVCALFALGIGGAGGCTEPPLPEPPCTYGPVRPNASIRVSVTNTFPARQYIYLDGTYLLGTVGVASSCWFRVPAGRHDLSAADSADPHDNAITRSGEMTSELGWTISLTRVRR